jgi:uncharacterized protein (DUF362 family)
LIFRRRIWRNSLFWAMKSKVSRFCDPKLASLTLPDPPFDPPNPIYSAVERVLLMAGAPRLEGIVPRGSRILIKPNFVTDRYFHERLQDRRLLASSTHASVIRPLIDFALERGAAEVTVADSPIEACDLGPVLEGLGFNELISFLKHRGDNVRFLDLRPFRLRPIMLIDDVRAFQRSLNLGGLQRRELAGDPHGYRVVDLGNLSCFAEVDARSERLRFHRANPFGPIPHHSRGRHEYGIPQTVLDSDVVIHVPKLKTHKKSGVTLSLKSSIGLCGFKYWLPHYTAGTPPGGDEFPDQPTLTQQIAMKLSRVSLPLGHSLIVRAPKVGAPIPVTEGSWEGNDTIWRTTLDLARILLYSDRRGKIGSTPVRGSFTLIDGIVAGEGEGPFGVTPVPAGILIAGIDPVSVDRVGARAMGFDWSLIPTIARASDPQVFGDSGMGPIEVVEGGVPLSRSLHAPRSWPSLRSEQAPVSEIASLQDWPG